MGGGSHRFRLLGPTSITWRLRPLALRVADAEAAASLIDELDAGQFKRSRLYMTIVVI